MGSNRLKMMEEGNVVRAILRLAVPTMLGMVVQMVYNMTDTYFIGQTGDPYLVAGISLVMPLFYVIQGIGNIFAVGSASLISRQLGAKQPEKANRTCAVAVWSTVLLGAFLTVALLLLQGPILSLTGMSEATAKPANDYFHIIAMFAMPMILNVTLGGQLRSEGATHHATIGTAIGLGVNILLDPLLILRMGLNAAGAAWATVIGACCSITYFLTVYGRRKTVLRPVPRNFRPQREIYAETLKIGGPAALSQIVMSFTSILSNNVAASFGDVTVAGAGVYMRVGTLCLMLLMGLTTGYQPFAGYNYGAGNYARLRQGFKATALIATGVACVFDVLFLTRGESMIRFFIDDAGTVEVGAMMLRALCAAMPFVGLQLTLTVTFQALGKAVRAMIITVGRQLALYVPLLMLLPKWFGIQGFAFAQPVADILTTVIAAALFLSLFRHLRAEEEQAAGAAEGGNKE